MRLNTQNIVDNLRSRIQLAEQRGYTGIVIDCIDVSDLQIDFIKESFEVKEMADDDTHYYIISNHPLKLN